MAKVLEMRKKNFKSLKNAKEVDGNGNWVKSPKNAKK